MVDHAGPFGSRRLLGVLLIALVVLLAGELVVRVRADALPPNQTWFGPEMQYKSRQIDTLEQHGGASVVFIGSSNLDAAGDTRFFTETPSNRPVYNASTGAGTLTTIDVWSERFALPRLQPDVVVIGLTGRELNPNNPAAAQLERDFMHAPAVLHLQGRESTLETAERHLESWSYLFRYRTSLRQPRYLEKVIGLGSAPGPNAYSVRVGPTGQYLGFLNAPYDAGPNVRRQYVNQGLNEFTVGRTQTLTLLRLVKYAEGQGANVVLVDMPVSPDLISYYPHGQADASRAHATLQRIAQATGSRLLDPGVWPARYFADPGHVNRAGSERFSGYLAAQLHSLGLTSPH